MEFYGAWSYWGIQEGQYKGWFIDKVNQTVPDKIEIWRWQKNKRNKPIAKEFVRVDPRTLYTPLIARWFASLAIAQAEYQKFLKLGSAWTYRIPGTSVTLVTNGVNVNFSGNGEYPTYLGWVDSCADWICIFESKRLRGEA